MRQRYIACGIAAVAVVAILSASWVPAVAQGQSAAARPSASAGWTLERHQDIVRTIRSQIGVPKNWTPPRTSWGQPDLQGS